MSHSLRGGLLRYQGRLYVPNIDGLSNFMLEEDHVSRNSIYLGSTNMYHDLMEVFWWQGLKKDIVEFVAKRPNLEYLQNELGECRA